MTLREQVEQLPALGVQYAGFIFFPGSARYVGSRMSHTEIRMIDTVSKVGVFVNAPEEEVLQTAEQCRLQLVQLHGEESPEYCRRVERYVPVMKAFRVAEGDELERELPAYRDCCTFFLFDTRAAAYGGTGKKFDWNILTGAGIDKPYFLSGGIGPEDADAVRRFWQSSEANAMRGVDVNSRFESQPGQKDLQVLKNFILNLNK
jgi:phosphoribosylanthranilate isomerase